MLNLTYNLELSDFDGAGGAGSSPKQTENYNGVVTLPSDATMVVGGLVRERSSKTVQKVPSSATSRSSASSSRAPSTARRRRRSMSSSRRASCDPTFADLRLLTRGPMQRVDLQDELPAARARVHAASAPAIIIRR